MIKQEQLSPKRSRTSTHNIPTITTEPATSITVIKNEPTETNQTDSSPESTGDATHIYQQRKCMLSEYKELFSALWRLPDKEVQQKVLRCINAKYRSIETQTDPVEIIDIMPKSENVACAKTNDDEDTCVNINQESISSPNDTCSEPSKPASPKKRKRRRKVSLPQANKESRVAIAKKKQMAKMSRPPHQLEQRGNEQALNSGESKRPRLDSNVSDSSYLNYMVDDIGMEFQMRCKEKLFQNIIKDCMLANITLENGLLPIHDSIVKKQFSNLNIQIFIWKNWKGIDLNDILTDDDEDLLQLAITHNCSLDIIRLLLDKGLNPDCMDGVGNTAVHLAVLNDMDQFSLKHLITKIDLKTLLTLNDDGYTSLQLAIRQDCYLLAENILNAMDERLSGGIFYKRNDDELETDEKIRKKQFQSYYENVCQQMEIDDENGGSIIKNHDLKQRLLQAPDMRSGNTALFFAIENQSEHLIYFLLAHLTDPRMENLSGQDCKTFFSEFGKTLNLSLNIDSAMEKVIKLLS